MNHYLVCSSALIVITGLIHSLLGEKLIVIPVLKIDLPPLLDNVPFMKRVIRFAWHITTVCWLGIAYVLFELAGRPLDSTGVLLIQMTMVVSFISGLMSLIIARGRHFTWFVFLLLAFLLWKSLATSVSF